MEANLAATFDAGSSFNTKLRDTLQVGVRFNVLDTFTEFGAIKVEHIDKLSIVTPQGLLAANNERKSEIDALRGDHDTLRKDHDALVNTTERENDLR